MPAGGATRTASTLAAYIGTPGGTTQANALSDRCALIGGSDARIILGDDEAAPSCFGRKSETASLPGGKMCRHRVPESPGLFRQARKFGLGDIVSDRRDRLDRGGRSPNWIKAENWKHPAIAL